MAIRPNPELIMLQIDNRTPGKTVLIGAFMNASLKASGHPLGGLHPFMAVLEGDPHDDIRGCLWRIHGPGHSHELPPGLIQEHKPDYMNGFPVRMLGRVGDITSGMPSPDLFEVYHKTLARFPTALEHDTFAPEAQAYMNELVKANPNLRRPWQGYPYCEWFGMAEDGTASARYVVEVEDGSHFELLEGEPWATFSTPAVRFDTRKMCDEVNASYVASHPELQGKQVSLLTAAGAEVEEEVRSLMKTGGSFDSAHGVFPEEFDGSR